MKSKNVWLKISGASGILAPMVGFTCIFLAMAFYPQYSWTENSLSDLGGRGGVSAVLFNSGLILTGILAFVFALGLFIFLSEDALGRISAFILALATLALIAIGIFPQHVRPIHYYASVAFFVFLPLSMFFIGAAFLRTTRMKLGLSTFLTAIVVAVVWMIQFSRPFGSDVAIPETISALLASMWSIVLGFKMLKQASHSSNL